MYILRSGRTQPARAGSTSTQSLIAVIRRVWPICAHLQDWYLRYQLETVPGVAEVASIGGFVRQYQVNLDPNKLFSYGIPASMVIERVRESTNEVGGDVLEMGGAEYMVRGLGYLRSLSDLENVPVATKNGTPVLVRDLGTVSFGPDIRRGAADWQGEGETVGGIVVMRYGMNALNVIDGVKAKIARNRSLATSWRRDRRPATTARG